MIAKLRKGSIQKNTVDMSLETLEEYLYLGSLSQPDTLFKLNIQKSRFLRHNAKAWFLSKLDDNHILCTTTHDENVQKNLYITELDSIIPNFSVSNKCMFIF